MTRTPTEALFDRTNWSDHRQRTLLDAVSEVEDLDLSALENGNLAGALERIVNKHALDIPALRTAQKRGERYEIATKSGDLRVKTSMIDVVIPFDGDPEAFQITPTQCILGTTGQLQGQYLVISVMDDDHLQAELDRRLGAIQDNLRNLRHDVDTARKATLEQLQVAAEQRLARLKKQRQRDSKFDFPIDQVVYS
jgi:hypothetical protein